MSHGARLDEEINSTALADIAAVAGQGFFTIGGSMITGGSSRALFDTDAPVTLVIQVIPEPGTAMLIASALLPPLLVGTVLKRRHI
jgi:hypothetical protein